LSRAIHPSARLAIRVRKEEAGAVLRLLVEKELLDRRRKVLTREGMLEMPVLKALPGYQTVCQDHPAFYRKIPELAEILRAELSSEEIRLLPKGWFILGEVIIVKINPQLDHLSERIGQALLDIYPRCKTVLRDYGIDGDLRLPQRRIIAGKITETIHTENGVRFKLDPSRIMFSQGNLPERMRMSRVGRDETVVDMFAGIGYFSLPMAVHSSPKEVLAIELNPVSFSYLRENIRLNRVEDIVQPVLGDCRDNAPNGQADRVIMGMVQVTDKFLKTGIDALRPGGILHYHQTIPAWLYPQAAIAEVAEAAREAGRRAEIIGCIRVKKYSPGVVHAVVDARIDKDF